MATGAMDYRWPLISEEVIMGINVRAEGSWLENQNGSISSSWSATADAGAGKGSDREAQKPNAKAINKERRQALRLIPYEKLDTAQTFASPGDTIPIVFGNRVNSVGGVWISPPLIDSSSKDFDNTFVYLLTYGQASINIAPKNYYLGPRRLSKLLPSVTINSEYSASGSTCPIAGYSPNCNHDVFRFQADPLSPEIGSSIDIETIGDYCTNVKIRALPLYKEGQSFPTLMERFDITVYRVNNAGGGSTTVGTFYSSDTETISSITDTVSAGSYTYSAAITASFAAGVEPEQILIEFRQTSTPPTSLDRTSSYKNLQLLVIEGNLFNTEKQYSPATELKQLHTFMASGIYVDRWRFANPSISNPGSISSTTGPSNKLGDLAYFWARYSGKIKIGDLNYMGIAGVALCALFHDHYELFFNGVINEGTNFVSYMQGIAPLFLCSFYDYYGVYSLKPVLPLADNGQIETGALTPKEQFNDQDTNPESFANSIIAGSYRKDYFSAEDSMPMKVIVTWRGASPNILDTDKTTTVRYSDYSEDAPEETYDMTDFCTSEQHASMYAKYVLATRRYSRHMVSFQTGRNVGTSDLSPFDLISISLSRVDSEGSNQTETEYYLVNSIEFDQTGLATIEASQFPLDGSGASIISNSILSGSFEVVT